MHPFVRLIRRYCIDYTNSHDLSVCDDIMVPGYELRIGGHALAGRDDAYKPAVRKQLEQFPGLGLTVHEVLTDGVRLALRFSEHGASARHDGRLAAWQGVGLYRWDGERLVSSLVEQDYFARREQLHGGHPNPVPAPALDPWTEMPASAEPGRTALVTSWLEAGVPEPTARLAVDDSAARPRVAPRFAVDNVVVDDMFGCGDRVAFHAVYRGSYLGGLTDAPVAAANPVVEYRVAGVVAVDGEEIGGGAVVTDRLGVLRQLQDAH